ncbi:hypothetical protein F4808DRAFT_432524 [Astrocystis sublimbata]|nr:hypothetical protein F4808DRAFT_432524 [Astrocystis sublimbata]
MNVECMTSALLLNVHTILIIADVRQKIHHFGGNPRWVTVVGQSVGASDTTLHLVSKEGQRGCCSNRLCKEAISFGSRATARYGSQLQI